MLLRIRLQRRVEALQIGEAQLLHNRQHLRLVPLHLVEPDLVNLRCRLVQRRALPDPKRIIGIAIRQRPDARILASLRNVIQLQKLREPLVRRQHIGRDRLQQLVRRCASAPPRSPLAGNFFSGSGKRAVLRLLIGQRLHLHQYLFHQIRRRHPCPRRFPPACSP